MVIIWNLKLETSKVYLEQAGFKVIHHYYRPEDKPRAQQPWLAMIAKYLNPDKKPPTNVVRLFGTAK